MKLWLVGHTFIFLFCWCLLSTRAARWSIRIARWLRRWWRTFPKQFSSQNFLPFFCEFIHREAYSSDVSQMKLSLPSQSEVPSAFVRRAEVILSWVQSPAWHVTGVCPLITAHEGRKGRFQSLCNFSNSFGSRRHGFRNIVTSLFWI